MSDFNRGKMKYIKLQELCTDIVDCLHSTPDWKNEGIRVVRNFNLKNGNIDFSDGYSVDESTYLKRVQRAMPEAGDIIISREAPVGSVGIVPQNLKCCLGQRLVLLKVDKSKCDPTYLLFVLMSEFVQTQLKRFAGMGSTVGNLCIPDLKEVIIPMIDRNQVKIAKFLESINKKIMLNGLINDNLFSLAYDIYRHNFILKKPNGTVNDILIEGNKSPVKINDAKISSGDYPFFTSGSSILKWIEPFIEGRNCFLNTGGNADVKFYVGEAAYSTDTWCVSAKNNLSDYLYLFLYLIKPELEIKFFQGSGLKHLQKSLLKSRVIYIPENRELEPFNKQVVPIFNIISENIRENQHLISLKDWILPALMNGQVTIAD